MYTTPKSYDKELFSQRVTTRNKRARINGLISLIPYGHRDSVDWFSGCLVKFIWSVEISSSLRRLPPARGVN